MTLNLLATFMLAILGLAMVVRADSLPSDQAFLMASFRGNGEDGLHLAVSEDGLKWSTLNGDRSFLKPIVGESKIMRDPCLIQGPDGTFHLVWTTAWEGKTIGYASSKDLIHWSEQVAIPVMKGEPRAKRCWAPEIRWDEKNGNFLIFWSTSLGEEDYFRTYSTTTTDFKAFTPTKLFFDPGHSQIDATIVQDKDQFVMFYKHGHHGIRYATSKELTGPYENVAPLFTNDDWEGPFATKVGDAFYLYIDKFKSRERMGLWKSGDLKTFENVSAQATFPRGTLHCSILKVSSDVLKPILEADAQEMSATPPQPILGGYTADPHAIVAGDTYYIYPTTDKSEWQTTDFVAWSSKDLIHWKNEGSILDVTTDLSWAKIRAWAPAMAEKNGKFYFYFCAEQQIGVAVNDKPFGKFKDALGKPLIKPNKDYPGQAIDPFTFIDDDGQAYLYYGQGNLWAYKLKPDMISLVEGPPAKLTPPNFNEGIWVFKRKGLYYFMWSQNDARDENYQVAYGTSKSPLGPIEIPSDNVVLAKRGKVIGTGHHAIINVPNTDRWYCIFHRHAIPDGNGYTRQTCLTKMEFNEDGTIRKMDPLSVPFASGEPGEPIGR